MVQQTSAPAKIILFGEHAVVHGVPAIAVPVSSLRAYATIEASDYPFTIVTTDLKINGIPLNVDLEDEHNPLTKMVSLVCDHFNIVAKPSVKITLKSDIPIASGLGSGAAISTALGRAIASTINKTISDEDLNKLVYEVEKIHHGTPSGIDNSVIVYEMPIRYQKFPRVAANYTNLKLNDIQYLSVKSPFHIIIADTGQTALTHESVGDVRKLYEANNIGVSLLFDKIEAIVQQALICLASGSLAELGRLMTENHEQLQKLTVSSSELDKLVSAAINAGALGAKLSGGGRGGNMIALVDESNIQTVSDALLKAGATRVFNTLVQSKDNS